jgi:lipopolysaccharide transport system permease protein
MLKNLYNNRRYLWGAFGTDLRYRYAGTALGFFWLFIIPLMEVAIYAVVFSQLFTIRSGNGNGISYTLFLVTGLFPFLTFSQILTRGSNSINSNSIYIRRSAIPAEVFTFKEGLLSLFTFMIYIVFIIPINIAAQNPFTWSMLLVPGLAIMLMLLGFGISLTLSNLRVLFPDIGEIISVVLQLMRWVLPVMYSDKNFPAWLRYTMMLNPPYFFIRSFRDVIIDHVLPSSGAWLVMLFWIVFFLIIGSAVSRWLRNEVKDLL